MKAFSLAETLVVMLLLGSLLAVFGAVVGGYSRVSRFLGQKDNALQATLLGLQTMRAEAAEAVEILDPPAGSTTESAELRLRKVDPLAVDRLPETVPPAVWLPHRTLVTVRYHVVGSDLLRESVGGTGLVARGCSGIGVRYAGPASLEIFLSTTEETRVRRLSSQVILHLPTRVVP